LNDIKTLFTTLISPPEVGGDGVAMPLSLILRDLLGQVLASQVVFQLEEQKEKRSQYV
jgi:hypothetical protein